MKRSIPTNIMLIFTLLTYSVIGLSQQSDSLSYYMETAAKNNPTVMKQFNNYQAALQKVPQSASLPDPQLELGVFLSPMELMSGNQVADIKLMQMFPWFGVLKNAKDEMSLMAKAEFEVFRDAKLQVYYDVQRNWYDLYAVRRKIRISEKNVELLKAIERLTLTKYKSGSFGGGSSSSGTNSSGGSTATTSKSSSGMSSMGGSVGSSASGKTRSSGSSMSTSSMSSSSGGSSLSDVYRIQIERIDLENTIASLKNEEQVVIARFNSQLNRRLTTDISLPDTLAAKHLNSKYLTVSDTMFIRHPMLGMLQYEQQSLVARSKMQKQMGLPMVGVGLNYSLINKSPMSTSSMNGQDMIMPMVTLTLPIYRKKYKAMQSETGFLKAASEQSRQATVNALQTEYYEAMQLYKDAQRRMKLYESQSRLTKKTMDISMKSFTSSSLTDILLIRQQLLDYELKQVDALTDFNKAEAWIKRVIPNL